MFLINAFNLIDGINCLAGSIGFLVCAIFAFYFWQMHHTELLFLALAMCGSLGGFLFFNRTPARIFMGDTGSMFLGFIVAFFSINFIELNKAGYTGFVQPQFQSAPALVFGLLIIPVFDTCRVFILRILKKKSPFLADRNHIHHRLIDLNLSHLQATGVLLIVNIITLLPVFLLAKFRTEIVLLVMLVFVLVLNRILSVIHNKNLIKKVVKIEDFNYPEPTHRILVRNKTVLK